MAPVPLAQLAPLERVMRVGPRAGVPWTLVETQFVHAQFLAARSNRDIASHVGRSDQAVRLITLKGREGLPRELPALPNGESIPRQTHALPLAPWRPGSTHGWEGVSDEFGSFDEAGQRALCEERAVRDRRAFNQAHGRAGTSRRCAKKERCRAEEGRRRAEIVSVPVAPATASGEELGGHLLAAVSGNTTPEQRGKVAAPVEPEQQPGQVVAFTPINRLAQAGPSRMAPRVHSLPVPSSLVDPPLPGLALAPLNLAPPLPRLKLRTMEPQAFTRPHSRGWWEEIVAAATAHRAENPLVGVGSLELRVGSEPVKTLKELWSEGGALWQEWEDQKKHWRDEAGYK